jgi:NADH dehydrogenase (ubiquinone) 1 alpha subcomplex subunit 6
MYSLNLPVSALRTKMRQEFERHRYVSQTPTVDVLLAKSDMEFQETMNYWKQISHVLKYFTTDEPDRARLPSNFIHGFMEVCILRTDVPHWQMLTNLARDGIEREDLVSKRCQP